MWLYFKGYQENKYEAACNHFDWWRVLWWIVATVGFTVAHLEMRRNQFRRVFHPVNAKTPQESRMLRPVSLLIVTLAWSVIVFLLVTNQVMSINLIKCLQGCSLKVFYKCHCHCLCLDICHVMSTSTLWWNKCLRYHNFLRSLCRVFKKGSHQSDIFT